MSQASAVQASISGNVSGQVAVGDHILQLGYVNGGIVNIALSSRWGDQEVISLGGLPNNDAVKLFGYFR